MTQLLFLRKHWIKTYKTWKYDDNLCVGCGVNVETVDEILTCTGYSDKNDTKKKN